MLDTEGLLLCYWIVLVAFGWMFWFTWWTDRHPWPRRPRRPEKVDRYVSLLKNDSTDGY